MITIEPNLADPLGYKESNRQPMVAYRNLLSEGTITDALLPALTPRVNAASENTNEFWKPSVAPDTLRATFGSPETADIAFFDAHTLGSSGSYLVVEYQGASHSNLLRWSEDISNGVWSKTNASVTTNAAKAPDGSMTADKLTATGAGPMLAQAITPPGGLANKTFTYSGWVWTDSAQPKNIQLYAYGATGLESLVGKVITATTTPVRFEISISFGAAPVSTAVAVRTDPLVVGQYFYFWGAQFEEGSLTSYLKTTTAAVTSTWHDVAPWIVPTTNDPIMLVFPSRASDGWGFRTSALAQVGVAWIGPRLVIPGGVTPDYVPTWASARVTKLPSQTMRGHFRTQRVLRKGGSAKANFVPISKSFALNDMANFRKRFNEGRAFIWAPAPELFPEDAAYCWAADDNIVNLSMREGGDSMDLSMQMETFAYVL